MNNVVLIKKETTVLYIIYKHVHYYNFGDSGMGLCNNI
jgi:hypothetical protein